jgi:hypothetical protein
VSIMMLKNLLSSKKLCIVGLYQIATRIPKKREMVSDNMPGEETRYIAGLYPGFW